MPIPVPVLIIAVVVVLLIGGGIAFVVRIFGKTIVFVGMKGAGKTTAIEGFKAVSQKNKKWKASNPEATMNFIKRKLSTLKTGIDTPGAQDLKKHWSKKIDKADWFFYFFDITRLDELMDVGPNIVRYNKLVRADLRDIASGFDGKHKPKPVLVIATHTDQPYDKDTAELYRVEILKELGNLERYAYVEGSLLDYDSVSKLYHDIEENIK